MIHVFATIELAPGTLGLTTHAVVPSQRQG